MMLKLVLADNIETPHFLPNHNDVSIARRSYLRVSFAQQPTLRSGRLLPLKVWLVQLSHIKVGGKRGPSHLGTNPLNKKIRLLCAALNQGRDEAAAASTRGNPLIPVTLGDQNLTKTEVLTNGFFLSSYRQPINVAASNVVEAYRHQDLIVVDADPGVTMEPIGCDVVGFDRAHKAVQARIAAVSASPEVAASAAAEVAAPAAAEVAALAAASAAAVQEEPSSESEALEAAIEGTKDEVDYGGSSDDMEEGEPMPFLAELVLPTGADVVQELDRDAQADAAQEDDEATVATIDEVDSDSSDTQEEPDEGQEDARVQESEVSEALVAVAASTREPLRRQVMKSRIVVTKEYGSEKYFMVLAASQSEAEIDRVIAARKRAMLDEGNELFGTSTYDASARLLHDHRRAWLARPQEEEGHSYMVFGAALQKRSRFYAFSDWAATPDGSYYLHKEDKQGRWQSIPRTSDAGRFVIPRYAKRVFKTHCDHTFGGQVWFDVLNQVGGCPTEFVDAWNAVINQRLQVGF